MTGAGRSTHVCGAGQGSEAAGHCSSSRPCADTLTLRGAEADERHRKLLVERLGDEGAVGAVVTLDTAEDRHDRPLPQLRHRVQQRCLQQDAVQGKVTCECSSRVRVAGLPGVCWSGRSSPVWHTACLSL